MYTMAHMSYRCNLGLGSVHTSSERHSVSVCLMAARNKGSGLHGGLPGLYGLWHLVYIGYCRQYKSTCV